MHVICVPSNARYLCFCLPIVLFNIYCVVFLFRFSASMLLVSRYCPFLIASSIFSNVYCIRNDIMSDTIVTINLHLINVNYKQSQTHELCQ
jgi:hypothetical protein